MALTDKLTAIADEVRTLAGVADKLNLDDMATHTHDANTEVGTQENLIEQIRTALQGKAVNPPTEDLNDVLTEQEALIAELQAILKVRASDDDYTAETWTFTLEDGTTLEKVVVLSV